MKYPQGYIFLGEMTKLPPLATLQAWFKSGTEIYVSGVSRKVKVMEERISKLAELHRHAWTKSDYQMQCIVFAGSSVTPTFLLAHGTDVLKVYWIDSVEQVREIDRVMKSIYDAKLLNSYIQSVRHTYTKLSEYIKTKTGATLVGDAEIEQFFMGRAWGTTSEAEIHIRQIAKNETRAGVLRRIDLEDNAQAVPKERTAATKATVAV